MGFSLTIRHTHMPNLAQLLNSKAPRPHQRAFEICREIASGSSSVEQIYVVGGVVRDLIIDREPGDIDLTVVGNAEQFATDLAERLSAQTPKASQFFTFKISSPDASTSPEIDIVVARSESYESPAALPTVVPAGIEEDLLRRDFTLNSMAISLRDSDFGNLVDPSGGFSDVIRKQIKIHHPGSFEDDPTRLFRAVKYSTRLGYKIEKSTQEAFENSIAKIDLLSGTRVRNELVSIFHESQAGDILREMEQQGLVAAISPALRINSRSIEHFEQLPSNASLVTRLAVLTFGMNAEEANTASDRLDGGKEWHDGIFGMAKLGEIASVLDQDNLKNSEIVDLLSGFHPDTVRAYVLVGPPLPRRDRMSLYLDKLRNISAEVNGDDLIQIGVPQGPVMGKLLDLTRRERLDGNVNTKAEELELVRSRLPNFLLK